MTVTALNREWRWAAIASGLTLLLTQLPPTIERLAGPADRIHIGTYLYAADFGQYLAAMRESAATGSWLIHDHLSAEPHDPVLLYPLYSGIGMLAHALHIPDLALYAVVEDAARLGMLLMLYAFFAKVLPEIGQRRAAFVLTLAAGGLGIWVWVIAQLVGPGANDPSPLYAYVEVMTFSVLWVAPHVALGLALSLASMLAFSAAAAGSRKGLLALVLIVLALALIHPFDLPVLLAAFGVYAVLRSVQQRRVMYMPFAAVAAAAVVAVPWLLLNFITFTFDPFWGQTYGAQNVMPSPLPWEIPIDYGVLALLAPFGIARLRHDRTPLQTLLLVWLAVGVLAMYAPVPYQRRFAFGLQPILAALAVVAWPLLKRGASAGLQRLGLSARDGGYFGARLLTYGGAVAVASGTTAILFGVMISAATNKPLGIYIIDRDTYAVGEWLGSNSGPADVVATSEETGNVLSGLISGRTTIGYPVATLHYSAKLASTRAMYDGTLDSAGIQAFLTANHASYLIYGPQEEALGSNNPGTELGLPVAVQIGATTAYRVADPL